VIDVASVKLTAAGNSMVTALGPESELARGRRSITSAVHAIDARIGKKNVELAQRCSLRAFTLKDMEIDRA
jgi:hypothetical protein